MFFYNLEDNTPIATRRSDLQLEEARLKLEDVAASIAEGEFEASIPTGRPDEKRVYTIPAKKAARRAN